MFVNPLYRCTRRAATWLLYALLFPLYRPLHYVLAAGAAAVIGIVARLLCPNTVEEVPEEPKSTGNAELDKMIDDGRKAIAEMKRLDDNIADPTISAQIVPLAGAFRQGSSPRWSRIRKSCPRSGGS